jgi:hypothetical protein
MEQKTKQILDILSEKGVLKQKIFDNTLQVLRWFKQAALKLEQELNLQLTKVKDARVRLKYRNITAFQAELKVAGDMLVFYMHSNIFKFDDKHKIWKTDYLKQDPAAGYVGVIYIYNFLADSFKYNRLEDKGYLITRIFINKDMLGWVERMTIDEKIDFNFVPIQLNQQIIMELLQNIILFALQFDLLVPPYDLLKLTTVQNILEARKIGAPTGKRVGFMLEPEQTDRSNEKLLYSGG